MPKIDDETVAINALSRKEVLVALRSIAADLERPLESLDLTVAMWRSARRHFGSMAKAREAAGLPDPIRNTRWTEDVVLEEIRTLSRAGVIISETDLNDIERGDLLGAITEYFGSIVRLDGLLEFRIHPRGRPPSANGGMSTG